MSEANDLKEFNERVFGGTANQSGGSVTGRSRLRKALQAIPDSIGEDGTEKTSTNIGLRADSQMWAVYGNQHYSACEKAVDVLPPGQYVVDVSNELGIHFRLSLIHI